MIITNPSLPPSKRFFEVVNPFIIENGFSFKAGKCKRIYDNRTEIMNFSFLTWGNIVAGHIIWGTSFNSIEKLLLQIEKSKKRILPLTLRADIVNYEERRKDAAISRFNLFDPISYKYDDFSINRAANEFIESYENYIQPFFEKFKDLKGVADVLNEIPVKRTQLMNVDKHIEVGLMLAYRYAPDTFDDICRSYKKYIADSIYSAKEKYEIQIDQAILYIENNKAIISGI
jgi:hypothetical protein